MKLKEFQHKKVAVACNLPGTKGNQIYFVNFFIDLSFIHLFHLYSFVITPSVTFHLRRDGDDVFLVSWSTLTCTFHLTVFLQNLPFSHLSPSPRIAEKY